VQPFETPDAPELSAPIAATMCRSNVAEYPADRLEALIVYFTPVKLCQLAIERQCLVALVAGKVVGTAAREVTSS
jgi:hypothetical protein